MQREGTAGTERDRVTSVGTELHFLTVLTACSRSPSGAWCKVFLPSAPPGGLGGTSPGGTWGSRGQGDDAVETRPGSVGLPDSPAVAHALAGTAQRPHGAAPGTEPLRPTPCPPPQSPMLPGPSAHPQFTEPPTSQPPDGSRPRPEGQCVLLVGRVSLCGEGAAVWPGVSPTAAVSRRAGRACCPAPARASEGPGGQGGQSGTESEHRTPTTSSGSERGVGGRSH